MYIETNARTLSSEDMRLVISKRNADLLFDFVRDSEESAPKVTFSPRKTHLLMFSLLFSSAFSGMLLYGMFMFEAYKIIGLEFEQKLMLKVNSELTRIDSRLFKLSQTIPKAVLALGGLGNRRLVYIFHSHSRAALVFHHIAHGRSAAGKKRSADKAPPHNQPQQDKLLRLTANAAYESL